MTREEQLNWWAEMCDDALESMAADSDPGQDGDAYTIIYELRAQLHAAWVSEVRDGKP